MCVRVREQSHRAFKTTHTTFLTATDERVHGDFHNRPHHELPVTAKFTVEHHHGGKVSLKTSHGQYIAVDAAGAVVLADRDTDDSRFHLEHHHGKVSFRSHGGRYLGVDALHNVKTSEECKGDEHFDEVEV